MKINRMEVLKEECSKARRVHPSLIANYEKFLNLLLPRDLESLTVILPYEMLGEAEKIRKAVEKVRPSCQVKILISTDSKEITFCL